MRPLLINTSDHGGAANACIRMHKALIEHGVESKFLSLERNYNDIPKSFLFEKTLEFPTLKERISTKLIKAINELKAETILSASDKKDKELRALNKFRPFGLEMLSFPYSNYDIRASKLFKEADLIHLHWVSMFIDFPSFFKSIEKPIVWTLHDMNPFTGGEHYVEQFLGIDEKGFPIKRKISEEEKTVFKKVRDSKINYLQNVSNLHIVTPSAWLANEAKQSEVFGRFKVSHIPNGIDIEIFKPKNKEFSREILNIPQNKKVLLFVSDILGTKRKGFEYLQKVLPLLPKNVILLSVGSKNESLEKKGNYIELGSVKDELLMSMIYSAADAFIIPSLMDNLPNTVVESLCCGTPVIGFPTGGIPEMIKDGKNGYICDEISVPSLKDGIEKFLSNVNVFERELISQQAAEKYNMQVQAQVYIELYKKINAK